MKTNDIVTLHMSNNDKLKVAITIKKQKLLK